MHEHLHNWFVDHWLPTCTESHHIYKNNAKEQIMWVRDNLVGLVWADTRYTQRPRIDPADKYSNPIGGYIIGIHYSKSVELPVYSLERPDLGLQIVLRGNFHNWKLSCITDTPLSVNLTGLCCTEPPHDPEYTGDDLRLVYFEGFPRKLVFGFYDESDHCKWSCMVGDRESVWTTVFLICRAAGIVQPLRHTTRDEQQANFAADRKASEQHKQEAS